MANPIILQDEDSVQEPCFKRSKLDNAVCAPGGDSNLTEQVNDELKLKQFQSQPLDQNIDYITLKSSLSLLQSNLSSLENNIQELSNFKKTIQESDNVKDMARLINKNSNYLNEITYKGSCIKCPVINWDKNYGIKLEKLNDDECYDKLNEEYEILKRDKLFN